MKTASLCNKRNPTNANTQKLKQAQSELTKAYQKNKENTSKTRSLRFDTWLKIDNLG